MEVTTGGGGGRRVRYIPVMPNINVQPEQWKWENVEDIDENDGFPFNEIEGRNVRMRDNATVLDYVELYLTDEIMQHIVQETNRFAQNYISDHPDEAQKSYVSKWKDITVPELKKFLGLVILMGIVHKPSLPHYWSTNDLYWTPISTKSMPRNRFYLILKFLHFNDNNDPEYDILRLYLRSVAVFCQS